MAVINKLQLTNASIDANDLGAIVNGSVNTIVETRLGETVDSAAKAIQSIKVFNYRDAWITATLYAVKDVVTNSGVSYVAVTAHTSGTFATDLAAGKWVIHQGATKEELAASDGSSLIGFTNLGSGAETRPLEDKILELGRSPTDYGMDVNSANINLATSAADVYSSALTRTIILPDSQGAIVEKVCLRNGQSLKGSLASYIDFSGMSGTAGIVTGARSTGAVDDPGPPIEISGIFMFSGVTNTPNVDTSNTPGAFLTGNFLSGPGLGFKINNGDTLTQGNIFDLGQIHVDFASGASNAIHSGNLHFEGTIQTRISGAGDINYCGDHFEYFHNYAILFDTGSAGGRAHVSGCTFLMHEQFTGNEAAICMRSDGGRLTLTSSKFNNLYGAALAVVDANGEAFVSGCMIDGRKSRDVYTEETTTMRGIDIAGAKRVEVTATKFCYLPGQPMTIGGVDAVEVIISGVVFKDNTGGTTEINITNLNPTSSVTIVGCVGDGRPFVNQQSTVPVKIIASDDGAGNPTVASATTVTIPAGKEFVYITGTTNIVTITAGWAGQIVTLYFAGALTITDGSNLIMAGNLVTSANANITFRCDGTNWHEISRSVN